MDIKKVLLVKSLRELLTIQLISVTKSNCEAFGSGESKRHLKLCSDEHKKSVRNCDCDKSEIPKHCWEADHNFSWDQKEVVDRENMSIPRKIQKKDTFFEES